MKIKLCLVISLLFAALAPAFSQGQVNVNVSKFDNNKGSCIICLYDNAKDFKDNGKPVQCTTVNITNHTTKASFENIVPGQYAVMVIHDANNNRRFDTNFMGIPKEGYGASQNKLPFAAAPKFDENKFTVTNGHTSEIHVRLRYIF